MKPADICLAVLVAAIWGLSFVAARIALDELSPPLMTALRFGFAALPCLLVPRPKVPWPILIAISGTLFLGQFLAQAYGIGHGVPVGLASVIVQSQALFTVGFAALAFREWPTPLQTVGIGIATVGLLMICGTVGYDFSVGAFAVLMICPVSFAIGNLLLRRAHDVPMFDLSAWLCLVAAVPLFALTLLVDGPKPSWQALSHMSWTVLGCMVWIGGISTCVAYWLWRRLLRHYTTAQVVPFALLVPFVGSAASSMAFGERFGPLRLSGMLIVVCGIAVMLLSKRWPLRRGAGEFTPSGIQGGMDAALRHARSGFPPELKMD
jgi:O-acetylserine/cysteine efflux transporter